MRKSGSPSSSRISTPARCTQMVEPSARTSRCSRTLDGISPAIIVVAVAQHCLEVVRVHELPEAVLEQPLLVPVDAAGTSRR